MDNFITSTPSIQPLVATQPAASRKLLLLGGGAALLIVGIVIGIFGVKFSNQSQNQSQLTLTPSPSQSPTPILAPDPTANWKTYENKEHGYEVEYPSDYKLFFDGKTPIIMKPGGEREGTGAFSFYRISFTPLDTSKELRDLVTENINTTKQVWGVDSPEVKSISPIYEAIVGNLNGLSFDMVCVGYCHNIFIKKDATKSFQITVRNANKEVKNMYQSEVDQILSTFKFIDYSSSAPSSTDSSKRLTYNLPIGWKTVQSSSLSFEVGYDPATTRADVNSYVQDGISLFKENFTNAAYFTVRLMSYSGGSRHQFLYNYLGEKPVKEDLMPNYHETEYLYDGKSCLFLVGISISQFPTTFGMCDAGGGKAFLITSFDNENYEEPLRTIKSL